MPAVFDGRKAPRCCDYPLQPAGEVAECAICGRSYSRRELLDAIRDYNRVDDEPTPEMIDAGGRAIGFHCQKFGHAFKAAHYSSPEIEEENRQRALHAYRAMRTAR